MCMSRHCLVNIKEDSRLHRTATSGLDLVKTGLCFMRRDQYLQLGGNRQMHRETNYQGTGRTPAFHRQSEGGHGEDSTGQRELVQWEMRSLSSQAPWRSRGVFSDVSCSVSLNSHLRTSDLSGPNTKFGTYEIMRTGSRLYLMPLVLPQVAWVHH